jgi:hypothetical protein
LTSPNRWAPRIVPGGTIDRAGTFGQQPLRHEDRPMIDDPEDAVPSKTGNPDPAEYSNTSKDPQDWVTGDEPMTGAQASYLGTLCEEAGVEFDPSLTKAAASERIDQLKAEVPRLAGTEGPPPQA